MKVDKNGIICTTDSSDQYDDGMDYSAMHNF